MASLLLFKHQKVGTGAGLGCGQGVALLLSLALPAQGVFLSQLLGEFSWLTEETLLRGFDVGFSGQLRCLVQHALSLLRAQVAVLRVHRGDLLVVAQPGPGLAHLARLSAELLPAFLSEAVGGESWLGLRVLGEGGAGFLPDARPPPQPVRCAHCWQAECHLRDPGSCRALSC